MKREGCSILFINSREEILLFLRDDTPLIPFPDMWDVPGGHLEGDESPEQCIIREMKEEMDLDLEGFDLFSVTDFADRREYTFWKRADLTLPEIVLREGRCLKWFTRAEAEATDLAWGFNGIVANFFDKRPFDRKP